MACCPPDSIVYLAADHADEGSVRSIDGVSFYQVGSGPSGLLICPDIGGWNAGRTRAIADDFAKKGLSVWVPKLLPPFEGGIDGDGVPPGFSFKDRGAEVGRLFKGDWAAEKVVPKLQAVVKAMKSAGVKRMCLLGFCYGCWSGMHLVNKVDFVCCASAHPSLHIEGIIGGDPVAVARGSKAPWALFPAGKADAGGDPDMYDVEGAAFKALEEKFPGKNVTKRFPNVPHGFVTRGSIKENTLASGDEVPKAAQECIADICEFFAANRMLRRDKAGLPPPPIKLRKPKFGKVGKVMPEARGLNLMLKAVRCEETEPGKTWEAVLGDDTGVVTFSLRSKELANLCKAGSSVRVQNARVLMMAGHIRVIIDKWAVLKAAGEPVDVDLKTHNDVSAVEYEPA